MDKVLIDRTFDELLYLVPDIRLFRGPLKRPDRGNPEDTVGFKARERSFRS